MPAAVALICAAAAAGCGVGPGEAAQGTASLTVTRDYGTLRMLTATLENPTPSDTVVRFLDEHAEIETEYSGNFVSSIDGVEGSTVDGGFEDWFFFVNGVYSDVGAGEFALRPGDRVWWDHRAWAEAYRVPIVVGSFPEPWLHGFRGGSPGASVQCVDGAEGCDEVLASLEDAGVEAELVDVSRPEPDADMNRVLVGAWDALRTDPAARMIEGGPGESGVYAEIDECTPGDWELELLASDGEPRDLVPSGGFVAAVRRAEEPPTLLVAGLENDGVTAAAGTLAEDTLRDRYALASDLDTGEQLPIPAPAADPPVEEGCE